MMKRRAHRTREPEVKQESDVARVLEKTIEALLGHPFRLDDAVLRIAFKVDVALFPDDGPDTDTSGDRYLFYPQKMTEMVAVELTLENQLRQALDKEEFVLHYQPKVNLVSGKLTGAEALICWNDPRTGLAAVRIAVNVSPLQLRHRGFVAEVRQSIGIGAQAAVGLALEITESLMIDLA